MKSLIRLARQKKGLSIKDMCELTHTSPNTFVNYEDVIRQFIERS